MASAKLRSIVSFLFGTIHSDCIGRDDGGRYAACSGNGTSRSSEEPQPDLSPLEVTIATQQVGEVPKKDNEFIRGIEKFTNSHVEIRWIPAPAYEDKKLMIASGKLPKAFK